MGALRTRKGVGTLSEPSAVLETRSQAAHPQVCFETDKWHGFLKIMY